MKRKDLADIEHAAQSMIQGSLSEFTRQCGDPACACAADPARRHGPHLYLKFSSEGKAQSVYVPAEQAQSIRDAHQAWLRFQEIGTRIASENRAHLLNALQRGKELVKAQRAKTRRLKVGRKGL